MGTNMRFRAALLTRIRDGEDWPVSLRLHNIGHMNCIVGCIYFVYIFIIFLHYFAYFWRWCFLLTRMGDGEDWPVSLRLHNIGHMNCIVGCIYFVYIFIIFLHYCAYFWWWCFLALIFNCALSSNQNVLFICQKHVVSALSLYFCRQEGHPQRLNSAGSRQIPDPAPLSWDPAPKMGDPLP